MCSKSALVVNNKWMHALLASVATLMMIWLPIKVTSTTSVSLYMLSGK